MDATVPLPILNRTSRSVYSLQRLPTVVMKRILILTCSCLLLVFSGTLHGLWSARWGPRNDEAIERARARMEGLPPVLGNWDGRPVVVDQSYYPEELHGHILLRRYVNRVNGNVATVILSCGEPRSQWSSHTPLACYNKNGFEVTSQPIKHALPTRDSSEDAVFSVATFSKPSAALSRHVRVFWTWSSSGRWQAPDYPRLAFASSPFLYKLYVLTPLPVGDEPVENDSSRELIEQLIPELRKCLFFDPERS